MTTRSSVVHAIMAFEIKFGTMPTAHDMEIINLMFELETVAKEEFESTRPTTSNPVLEDVLKYHDERATMNNPKDWAHVQRKLRQAIPHNPWGASADDLETADRIIARLVQAETDQSRAPRQHTQQCRMLNHADLLQAFKYGGLGEATPEGVSPQGGPHA